MHIFVDEAGPFVLRAPRSRYSCIGALVVPSREVGQFLATIEALKRVFGVGSELKGSNLDEPEIATVIRALASFDLMFDVVVFDSFAQEMASLVEHREESVRGVVANIPRDHHLRPTFEELSREVARLPHQLYIQATLTCRLFHQVLERAPLYHVQRTPAELGSFVWQADPKDSNRSRRQFGGYDRFLSAVVKPWLQATSLREPSPHLEGADYSHFEKFMFKEPPEFLEKAMTLNPRARFTNLGAMLKDFSFPRSHTSLGLQAVDVLTNAVKRTLNRNLHPASISQLPKLMVAARRGQNTVSLSILGTGPAKVCRDPLVVNLVNHCNRNARPMLTERPPAGAASFERAMG